MCVCVCVCVRVHAHAYACVCVINLVYERGAITHQCGGGVVVVGGKNHLLFGSRTLGLHNRKKAKLNLHLSQESNSR